MPLVTVAMPVRHAAATLDAAFRSITDQTHRNLEILLILNGSDDATTSVARSLAASEPRCRLITVPAANLAAALNIALREAKGELVARMDADDACHPERIARQATAMAAHPHLHALGTAFDVVDATKRATIATTRPSTDPATLRWQLLLHNSLCHGSMMLRRDAILAAGGYDESRERAQDYELWLRLSGFSKRHHRTPAPACIGCLPEVLYQYTSASTASYSSSPTQAGVAAELLVEAWRTLPHDDDPELPMLLADAMGGSDGPRDTIRGIEAALKDAPSATVLLAWLWSKWFFPTMPARAAEASRLSRLREVGAQLRAKGVTQVTLWGAGTHTAWLIEHKAHLGLAIHAIVDDTASGQDRFGYRVLPPGSVHEDDTVLLSSDWHEDALWQKSSTLRERGVRVVRLYA